eukprot:Nk52_evm32s621 gene=Nk52_evmTU32s621
MRQALPVDRTVFVLDASPAAFLPTQAPLDFELKGRPNPIKVQRTLWSVCVECVVEYSRIAFDLFGERGGISGLVVDSVGNSSKTSNGTKSPAAVIEVLSSFAPSDQNVQSILEPLQAKINFPREVTKRTEKEEVEGVDMQGILDGIKKAVDMLGSDSRNIDSDAAHSSKGFEEGEVTPGQKRNYESGFNNINSDGVAAGEMGMDLMTSSRNRGRVVVLISHEYACNDIFENALFVPMGNSESILSEKDTGGRRDSFGSSTLETYVEQCLKAHNAKCIEGGVPIANGGPGVNSDLRMIDSCEILIVNVCASKRKVDGNGELSLFEPFNIMSVEEYGHEKKKEKKDGKCVLESLSFVGLMVDDLLDFFAGLSSLYYNLRRVRVSQIPMKESSSSADSARSIYDVVLLHHHNAKALTYKDLLNSASCKEQLRFSCGRQVEVWRYTHRGKKSKNVESLLKWRSISSDKKIQTNILNCSQAYRITPVEINSGPSNCIMKYVTSGRVVMLEVQEKSPYPSHALISHEGDVFLHSLEGAPVSSVLKANLFRFLVDPVSSEDQATESGKQPRLIQNDAFFEFDKIETATAKESAVYKYLAKFMDQFIDNMSLENRQVRDSFKVTKPSIDDVPVGAFPFNTFESLPSGYLLSDCNISYDEIRSNETLDQTTGHRKEPVNVAESTTSNRMERISRPFKMLSKSIRNAVTIGVQELQNDPQSKEGQTAASLPFPSRAFQCASMNNMPLLFEESFLNLQTLIAPLKYATVQSHARKRLSKETEDKLISILKSVHFRFKTNDSSLFPGVAHRGAKIREAAYKQLWEEMREWVQLYQDTTMSFDLLLDCMSSLTKEYENEAANPGGEKKLEKGDQMSEDVIWQQVDRFNKLSEREKDDIHTGNMVNNMHSGTKGRPGVLAGVELRGRKRHISETFGVPDSGTRGRAQENRNTKDGEKRESVLEVWLNCKPAKSLPLFNS